MRIGPRDSFQSSMTRDQADGLLPRSTGVIHRAPQAPQFGDWPTGSRALSRRTLLRTTTGMATAVGLSQFLRRTGIAAAQAAVQPVPIPGGSPAIAQLAGDLFHVYGPAAEGLDPDDAEPITITDFDGLIGLAYVSGMVQRTNRATGEVRQLPFVDSDMCFMQGAYRGTDGQMHQGTFAFI